MESPRRALFVWTQDQPQTEDLDAFVAHLLTGQEQALFEQHYGHYGPRPGVDYRDVEPGAPTGEWIDVEEEA